MGPSFISAGRMVTLVVTVTVLFAAISCRLFYLHVLDQDRARRVIAESRYRFQEVDARRGVILDAHGAVLASSKPVWDIGVDPQVLNDDDAHKLDTLALILDKPVVELEQKFGWNKMALHAASEEGNDNSGVRWVRLAAEVDESVYKAVDKLSIKGVYGNRYYKRYYPCGNSASHVVGFMNMARTPVMGIEWALDYYLKGSSGWRVREINGKRNELRQFRVRDVAPQNGYNVQLSLDLGIQQVVESELDRVFEELQPKTATVIVSESRTGAILAMGNRPTYDPNHFRDYDLSVDVKNRAIADTYELGSTFKVITAAGFLDDKLGDTETVFDCATRSVVHRNRNVRLPSDTRPKGLLPFHEIIKKSSNRGSSLAGLKLGEERFVDYCNAFGIGQRTGIELPGEARGLFHPLEKWDHYTLSRVSIGYGVGVTPLQMHMAMSVIANDGNWMAPHLATRALDSDMHSFVEFQSPEPRRVISQETANEIRDCLIEAVSLGGTGRRATLKNIQVAGKTGTSRVLLKDGYSETRHIGTFSGFFPAEDPEFVITVVVNDPQTTRSTYGGVVAAPVFRTVAEYIVSSRGIEATPKPVTSNLIAWNR